MQKSGYPLLGTHTGHGTNMFRVLKSLAPLLVPFSLFCINQISAPYQNMFNVKFRKNKFLYGHSFLNITDTNMEGCLEKCLEHICICLSFQLCDGKECQLCSKQDLKPSVLRERQGCTYYDFEGDLFEFQSNQQCDQRCFADGDCCTKCNPCHNGGTCSGAVDNTVGCNTCTCQPGFTGNLCQHPIRSCRGYANGNRKPGKYDVLSDKMKPYEVFCDFDLNSSMSWTLIQSYQLQNVDRFRNSFFLNSPVNINTLSWKAYRLSRFKMRTIHDDSTKWRVTCQYDSDGVVYRDYIRGANDKIDILMLDSEECVEVEYINIRGESCHNCSAYLLQSHTLNNTSYLCPLHSDSYLWTYSCTFQPHESKWCPIGGGEDNFGYYYCTNTKHRCSATEKATSQTWFGG